MKVTRFLFPFPYNRENLLRLPMHALRLERGKIAPRRRMMIAFARRDAPNKATGADTHKEKVLMPPARRKKVTNSKIWNIKPN